MGCDGRRGPRDEGHLQINLSEFGLPVFPTVLVAKAPSQLVIPVDPARADQQLFGLLRRLRQSVEERETLSRAMASGYEELAGTLRSRPEEDGGFDFEEICGNEMRVGRKMRRDSRNVIVPWSWRTLRTM